MGNDGEIRASDSDRESVVEVLREAYADGRLNLDEFDERTTTAYAAKTWADLRELTSDLPAGANLGSLRAAAAAGPMAQDAAVAQLARGGGQPQRPTHGPGFMPFLPIAIFWLILAGAIHATGLVVAVIVLLFVWVRLSGRRYRGSGHRPGGSPPRAGGGSA